MEKKEKTQVRVRVFTTPVCPYCFTLKEFLKENNIDFEEIDVTKDENAREDMIKKTGQMAVPVIEIDGQVVVGFNKEQISKILNL